MHLLSSKKVLAAVLGISTAFLATIARIFLMLFGFNTQTLFFENKSLATVLYLFVILSVAGVNLYLKNKNVYLPKTTNKTFLLNLLSAVVFALLFFTELSANLPENTINRVTHWIALFAAILSVVYYLMAAFTKSTSAVLGCLNVAPVIYILCFCIDSFTAVSIKANSYYLFPNTISVIFLCFYILSKAKATYCDSEAERPLLSHAIMTLQILSFSFIPDVILLFSGILSFTLVDILITVLKGIYLIVSISDIYLCTKAETEEK